MAVPDVAFAPAPYAATADAKNADQMKFDLSKYDAAQGGSGTAAQLVLVALLLDCVQHTTLNPLKTATCMVNVGASLGALGNNKDITSSLMKLFG
jgi:hypothetical protein